MPPETKDARSGAPRLEKLGSLGALIGAAACPICFPKLAIIGAALGLGAFAPYEGYIVFGVQALFVLALIAHVAAYRAHRNRYLLALAATTVALHFAAFYLFGSETLLLVSLGGLVLASIWLLWAMRRCAACTPSAAPGR